MPQKAETLQVSVKQTSILHITFSCTVSWILITSLNSWSKGIQGNPREFRGFKYFTGAGGNSKSLSGVIRRCLLTGIWLCPHRKTNNGSLEGELLLGGTDEALYNRPINWLPVTAKAYWQIKLDRFSTFSKLWFWVIIILMIFLILIPNWRFDYTCN